MDNLDRALQSEIQNFLRKSFIKDGIERTEDIIRSVYNRAETIKELYLAEYRKLIGRK